MHVRWSRTALLVMAGALLLPAPSRAALIHYQATLTPANGSGVTGMAHLMLDTVAQTLQVAITASGLTPDQIHPQHIHGFPDDTPSRLATPADDLDGDGFIESYEAELVAVGPPLLPLTPFPMASAAGMSCQGTSGRPYSVTFS